MKIKKITATIPPIKNFMADDLKDLVVIAGPNGVGKTPSRRRNVKVLSDTQIQQPSGILD